MPGTIESITTAALARALDVATLRQQAIAANIANHATPGYVPQQVDFHSRMLGAGIVQLQPRLDASGLPARVHLDAEVADMARNAVEFQALARAVSRHLSLQLAAASDGKR